MKKLLFLPLLLSFNLSAADVALSWTAPSNYTPDMGLLTYRVYMGVGAAGIRVPRFSTTNLTATVTNLVPGVYTFSITSNNTNFWGSFESLESNVVATQGQGPTPAAPSIYSITLKVPGHVTKP